jgi:glycosyltransferase involved in cell wall biosynthesis
LRIVVVTTSFPRSDEDPSGHFVRSAAERLVADGAEVHVIAPGGSPLDAPREVHGLVVHRAGGGALFRWPGAAARAREAPWRLLLAAPFGLGVRLRLREIGRVDRAIAHWIVPSAFPLALALDAPLEVIAHGADVRLLLASPRPLRERVVETLLTRGARFTFAAEVLRSSLEEHVSPALAARLGAASRVEPPAIDVPDERARAAELRAELGLRADERLAVVACRLIASKRVALALEAAQHVGPALRLVVVGDGPERARLEARALALGVAARFTGALPRREALGWVAAADVLLHPSSVEAAPTVVREARAFGVPVVACDTGDLRAWAEADRGIVIAEPDPAAVARAARGLAF